MKKFIFILILFFSFMSQSVMAVNPETGWWWNAAESGRGFSIEQQGNSIFYAVYLYDDSGNNAWYTALMTKNTAGDFTGTLQQFSNGQTLLGSYQAPNVTNSNVGDITLAFDTPTTGTMTWPGGVVSIERFIFDTTVVTPVTPTPPKLNVATNSSGLNYSFGTQLLDLENAPADTDFNRWGMLHDGTFLRLYFFKQSSGTELYQFVSDQTTSPASTSLAQGFFQNPGITDAPADADTNNIAFVNNGTDSIMYMRGITKPRTVYPFIFNDTTNNFEYDTASVPEHNITGSPADADFSRWAMDATTTDITFYAFKSGSDNQFYKYEFSAGDFVYMGSGNTFTLTNLPANRSTTSFAAVFDKLNGVPRVFQQTQ